MANTIVPARGMRDILPPEKALREQALSTIRESYRQYGFVEIETPALEELSRLLSGQGGENEKMLFKVLRRGIDEDQTIALNDIADLGLRFDLTLPLARFIASHHGDLPVVGKYVQIGPVWRAERPQRGRYRQFTQCDIDIVGEPSLLAEVELVAATDFALTNLGLTGAWLRLNDRRVLYGLLEACGLQPSQYDSALITVDKIDKIGLSGVRSELIGKFQGSAEGSIDELVSLLERVSELPNKTDLAAVKALLPKTVPPESLTDLESIAAGLKAARPNLRVDFDVTLVRGMGYYTGPIFEMGHPGTTSSIAGGGRYDNMVGRFLGRPVPACGFSIGFERILDMLNLPTDTKAGVLVLYDAGVSITELAGLQAQFVSRGRRTRLTKRPKKLGTTLASAAAAGFETYVTATVAGTGELSVSPEKSLQS